MGPAGRVTSLGRPRAVGLIVRPERGVEPETYLAAPRPVLPRLRDGGREGRDAPATVEQVRPDSCEPAIQGAAREIIAKNAPRLGIQTRRPTRVPPARVDLATANGIDIAGAPRPVSRREGARRGHGRRVGRVPPSVQEDTEAAETLTSDAGGGVVVPRPQANYNPR